MPQSELLKFVRAVLESLGIETWLDRLDLRELWDELLASARPIDLA